MNAGARSVQRLYLTLVLLQTLAASLIWGINTLFLIDGGLSNTQAFAANAFFSLGLAVFEVPTGVVADTAGRRASYLLGTLTLSVSTVLYLLMWRVSAPFWAWAAASALLGLGFSFFSGADEAWLYDALTSTGYFAEGGRFERVLARGKVVEGVAMLSGAAAGGALAQATNLGVPYALRAVILIALFVVAGARMRDQGFTPARGRGPIAEVKRVWRESLLYGLGNRPVRWVMLSAPFVGGVSIYAFYALQPYLLQLYGDKRAFGVAGLAAAAIAGAQIAGGLAVLRGGRLLGRRTLVLLCGTLAGAALLCGMGLVPRFWPVLALVVAWGVVFAALEPVRQAYLNGLIPSRERATVLSFDSLLSSAGAGGIQPLLGRIADAKGYPASYLAAAGVQLLALPFLWLALRARAGSDSIERDPARA